MKELLKNINKVLPKRIDIFICSSSFEDRSLTIVKHIDINRIKHAIVCTNEDQKDIVGKNAIKIHKLFSKATFAKFDTNNPLTIADSLAAEINSFETTKQLNYVIDITTFTHEALLIICKLVSILKKRGDMIFFVYNSAKEYSYQTKTVEEIWLTKGLRDIRTVLGYPGKFKAYQKLHLLVLVGYEIERAKQLIQSYEPAVLSLGIGSKNASIAEELYSINKAKYTNLKVIYKDVQEFGFSCTNPVDTVLAIESQISKYSDYNVVVSPMNNKISTLGCALFSLVRPSVQLISSRANIYNTSYSKASEYFYVFEYSSLIKNLKSALKRNKLDALGKKNLLQ
jgi:hypothetical protein